MALPRSFRDRDLKKFVETEQGETAVRVVFAKESGGSVDTLPVEVINLAPQLGVDYDRIDVTYPSGSSELYSYSFQGSPTISVAVAYTDSTKENLTSVVVNGL